MGAPISFLPLEPLTVDDIDYNPFPLIIPEDVLQLQADALNVLENRVPITDFSPERQEKIKRYYQFSATRQNSKSNNIARRTVDTLDLL